MGILQNITDWMYMKTGKAGKVYPVQVEKNRLRGDEIVFDEMDRGRTLVKENGEKVFQLLNESEAEGKVSYEDFNDAMKGRNYVSIVMIDRDKFVPLNREFNLDYEDTYEELPKEREITDVNFDTEYFKNNFEKPGKVVDAIKKFIAKNFDKYQDLEQLTIEVDGEYVQVDTDYVEIELQEESQYDVDMNTVEYCLSVSSFLEWADQHIEQSWKITETSNEKWWEQEKFQAAILFISAGLFFIFLGYGQGQLFFKELSEQLAQNTEATKNLAEAVRNQIGGP